MHRRASVSLALEKEEGEAHDLSWRRNTQNPFTPRPPSPTTAPVIQPVEAILLAEVPGDPDHQVRGLHHHRGPKQQQGDVEEQEHVHQEVTIPLTRALCSQCLPRTDWLSAGSCERPSSYYYHHRHYCSARRPTDRGAGTSTTCYSSTH